MARGLRSLIYALGKHMASAMRYALVSVFDNLRITVDWACHLKIFRASDVR